MWQRYDGCFIDLPGADPFSQAHPAIVEVPFLGVLPNYQRKFYCSEMTQYAPAPGLGAPGAGRQITTLACSRVAKTHG